MIPKKNCNEMRKGDLGGYVKFPNLSSYWERLDQNRFKHQLRKVAVLNSPGTINSLSFIIAGLITLGNKITRLDITWSYRNMISFLKIFSLLTLGRATLERSLTVPVSRFFLSTFLTAGYHHNVNSLSNIKKEFIFYSVETK